MFFHAKGNTKYSVLHLALSTLTSSRAVRVSIYISGPSSFLYSMERNQCDLFKQSPRGGHQGGFQPFAIGRQRRQKSPCKGGFSSRATCRRRDPLVAGPQPPRFGALTDICFTWSEVHSPECTACSCRPRSFRRAPRLSFPTPKGATAPPPVQTHGLTRFGVRALRRGEGKGLEALLPFEAILEVALVPCGVPVL